MVDTIEGVLSKTLSCLNLGAFIYRDTAIFVKGVNRVFQRIYCLCGGGILVGVKSGTHMFPLPNFHRIGPLGRFGLVVAMSVDV